MRAHGFARGSERVAPRHDRLLPRCPSDRQLTVEDVHDAPGSIGDVVLVGDQHDRAARVVQLRSAVRECRRLDDESRLPVGSSASSERGFGHQRTGDRDPLLLSAGQLAWLVMGTVAESDEIERSHRELAPLAGLDARSTRAAAPRCEPPSCTAAG